jgi:hypothetical protein
MMGRIFESAQEVFTWVSPSFKDSSLAIQVFQNWSNVELSTIDPSEQLQEIPDAFDPRAFQAVERLFDCEYWFRIWVYQEVVLARKATLVCGPDRIGWDRLMKAVQNWTRLQEPELGYISLAQHILLKRTGYDKMVSMCLHRLARLSRTVGTTWKSEAKLLDLDTLLERTRHMKSTDPRDKIYAMLGAVDIYFPISVDYRKSTEEVYTQYAQAFIERRESLDLVTGAGMGRVNASPSLRLPTWVPDLRAIPRDANPFPFNKYLYKASGPEKPVTSFSKNGSILHADGFMIDMVARALPYQCSPAYRLDWRDLAVGSCPATFPSGITVYQAFFRTMTAQHSQMDFINPSTPQKRDFHDLAIGFMSFLGYQLYIFPDRAFNSENQDEVAAALVPFQSHIKAFIQWSGIIPEDLTTVSERSLLAPLLGPESSELSRSWSETFLDSTYCSDLSPYEYKYRRQEARAATRRSFFVTPRGYMGLGPMSIQPGDAICILYGCDRPLILRRDGQLFAIIGECYVDGIMFGEALQGVKAGQFEERTFNIK